MVKPVISQQAYQNQYSAIAERANTSKTQAVKIAKEALRLAEQQAKRDPATAKAALEQFKQQVQGKVDAKIFEKTQGKIAKQVDELLAQVESLLGGHARFEPTAVFIQAAIEYVLRYKDTADPKQIEKLIPVLNLLQNHPSVEFTHDLWKDFVDKNLKVLRAEVMERDVLNNPETPADAIENALRNLGPNHKMVQAQGFALIHLRMEKEQKQHLEKMGLATEQLKAFNLDSPYLGRMGKEPPLSVSDRMKAKWHHFKARIKPYAGVKEADQFNQDHPFKGKAREYGGDSPVDLQADLMQTLAKHPRKVETQFAVIGEDTVANAAKLSEGKKLGVVNCANRHRLGGSWRDAKGSQEESWFRQSNLFNALKNLRDRFKNHMPAVGALITPGVTGKKPDGTFSCDLVSIAAVDFRKGSSERKEIEKMALAAGKTPEEVLEQITTLKYAAMFGAFLENRNKELLISLPGLGAFQNDVEMVGRVLKTLLFDEDAPFHGKFEKISFNTFSEETKVMLQRLTTRVGAPKPQEEAPVAPKETKEPATSEEIVSEMIGSKSLRARDMERPTAFLFMGGSASGKSRLQEEMMKDCRKETLGHHDPQAKGPAYVKVDSDLVKEYLKGKPGNTVHKESTKIARKLFAEAHKNRQHIAYLGTGQDANYYKSLIKDLHSQGYVVHLMMADVDEETAVKRAADRTDQPVPEEVVRSTNRKAKANFKVLQKEVDSWAFYDNSGDKPVLKDEKKLGYQHG